MLTVYTAERDGPAVRGLVLDELEGHDSRIVNGPRLVTELHRAGRITYVWSVYAEHSLACPCWEG